MKRRTFIKSASGLFLPLAFPAVGRAVQITNTVIYANTAKVNNLFPGSTPDPGCTNATALDWASRVVTNGGATVSNATICAVGDFCIALTAAGIDTKMKSLCIFVPDSLTAALTPIYKSVGSDPWTKSGGIVAGNLTSAGLKGGTPGLNDHLATGVIPSAAFSNFNAGISSYMTNKGSVDPAAIGATDGGSGECLLYPNDGTSSYFGFQTAPNGEMHWTQSPNPAYGYFSGNRTSQTQANIYFANSTTPHASVASNGLTDSGTPFGSFGVFVFAANAGGATAGSCDPTLSFVAFHAGLTVTESLALYNAIQTCRVSLGGGFV